MVEKQQNNQEETREVTEEIEGQVEELEAVVEEKAQAQELEEPPSEVTAESEAPAEELEAGVEEKAQDQEVQEQPVEVTAEADDQTEDIGSAKEDEDQAIDEQSFQELYEESLKSIKEGEVVRGSIIQVAEDYVMVDIGYKSEGQIRISEFIDDEGNIKAKVGDEVDVLLEHHEDENGEIVLSKEKAAKIKVWDEISSIYQDDGVIGGRIVSKVKGGLSVDIGVQAFLPGSQVDLRPVRNLDSLIGQQFKFKILKYNKKRRNVVLSRRVLLEKERKALKNLPFFKPLQSFGLERFTFFLEKDSPREYHVPPFLVVF